MDIPIQAWHMVEAMQRDFNEHHMTQVPMTEDQLEEPQLMEEVSDQVGLNYPEIPDSISRRLPLSVERKQDQPKSPSQ